MTFLNSPKPVRPLFALGPLALSIFVQACGEAPVVREGDHSEQGVEQEEKLDARGENLAGESAGSDVVPYATDEEMLIAPGEEVGELAVPAEQRDGADECAPSVFPNTANVTYEVTETVTETLEVEVERQVPSTALLLLDRSLSMREDIEGSTDSRWDTMQEILFGDEQPLLESLQHEVALGMTHFTAVRNSTGEDGSGHCVDLTVPVDEISFEMNNYDALAAQQVDIELGYGTPTGEALRATMRTFQTVETAGSKHIVVVTDGEPAHCNALLEFSSAQAVDYVLEAARDAAASGITVHVIGIGPDVNEQHLQDMAAAGGGMYRSALTEQSLESAFADILAAVKVVEVEEVVEEREVVREVTEERRSCTFAMEFGDLGPEAFLEAGSVELGGESLVLDADDGWTINEADELELLGAACESYVDGSRDVELEVELACPNRFPGYAR